ncbi:proton-conducting transporter membrane subunit [Motiliproteus sp.]|uniref:proton-conducting transporter transmembrane domain-containing protein n=1 Tax=Motiliproteus sp. TaxID=1898955 RepID=UPI003BACA57E
MNLLLLLGWSVPLLLIPLMLVTRAVFRQGRFLLLLAPVPALMAVLLLPVDSTLSLPWLLLGAELQLDPIRRIFLALTSILWFFAGLSTLLTEQGDRHANRFRIFLLLCMAGNIGLIVSADMISFYVGFATMGLASYGLILHAGTAKAKANYAAKVYLVMTLMAEFLLLVAFLLIFQRTGVLAPSAEQLVGSGDLELALLFVAFAIKAGLFGFHIWLPLAHPAAPPAASAVLSGAMIKTALLGWIAFMPLGAEALPGWGWLFIGLGSVGAVCAIAIGLLQSEPKVMLAYSSISKMNLMIAVLGVALVEPRVAKTLILAIVAYAFFHGLNKGALFIGVGVIKRYSGSAMLLLLGIPAAILSGIPFGAGAAAKSMLSDHLAVETTAAITVLGLLTLLAFLTPLLMARFLYRMASLRGTESLDWRVVPWACLVVLAATLPLIGFGQPSAGSVWLWGASVLASVTVILYRPRRLRRLIGAIPPADLLALLSWAGRRPRLVAAPVAGWQKTAAALRQQLRSRLARFKRLAAQQHRGGDLSLSVSFPLLLLVLTASLLI